MHGDKHALQKKIVNTDLRMNRIRRKYRLLIIWQKARVLSIDPKLKLTLHEK